VAAFASAGAVITAATWTVAQAVDGVALKHAVDAWVDAAGPEKATRFATEDSVLWMDC
jgi:hypothetical protein